MTWNFSFDYSFDRSCKSDCHSATVYNRNVKSQCMSEENEISKSNNAPQQHVNILNDMEQDRPMRSASYVRLMCYLYLTMSAKQTERERKRERQRQTGRQTDRDRPQTSCKQQQTDRQRQTQPANFMQTAIGSKKREKGVTASTTNGRYYSFLPDPTQPIWFLQNQTKPKQSVFPPPSHRQPWWWSSSAGWPKTKPNQTKPNHKKLFFFPSFFRSSHNLKQDDC